MVPVEHCRVQLLRSLPNSGSVTVKVSEPDITAYMHQLARKKAKEEEVTHRQSEIVNARVWRVGDQMNLPSLEGSGRLLCMVSYIPIYSAYTHAGDGSLL